MQTAQSSDRAARIKRIRRRGCPRIIQALECGELGIKLLERISRLPTGKQSIELARCLEVRDANARRQAAWRTDPRRGKALFVSQSYDEARARRLRQIRARAIPELNEAFATGKLTLRRYDILSRLTGRKQRKAVRLERNRERAQNLAAVAIRSVLACDPQQIDLGLIASRISDSIRSSC